MTRRFKSLVLEGVSHMIDDPQGDWVRWCDCRDVERELSRLREGMPSVDAIRTAYVLIHGTVVSEYNGYSEKGRKKLYDVNNWLRRIAQESEGCGR